MIPVVELDEAVELLRNGASIKQSEYAGGTPITRIETIADWEINPERCGYADVSEDDFPNHVLQDGDILISHINSTKHLGKCAKYKGVPETLIHGMNLLGLRVNTDIADSDYIYRVLSSQEFRRQLPKITKNSVNQSSFTVTNFKALKIPLPPLKEQKRIAAILDKADAIRRKRQQAIDLTDKLLRSVFLELFGDPVTNPKGWALVSFGSVGQLDRGKSKHRPRNDPILLGGNHPLIQTGDVANSGGYITTYKSTYSDVGLKQSKKWSSGTLCITIAANIANTGILEFDACFPDSVVGFIPNKSVSVEYVQAWLGFLQKIIEDAAPESAQKNINLAILRDLEIPLPNIEMQNKFSQIVHLIKKTKGDLVDGEKQTINLFDSLAQQAFRGELTNQNEAA